MNKQCALALAASLLLGAALPAWSASVLDTGTPTLSDDPALLDAGDWYAASLTLTQDSTIQSVASFIRNGAAGESFTLALYADTTGSHKPGSQLYSTSASFASDGWNGAATHWAVTAGTYWVAVEVGAGDTLGSASITGALLNAGTPTPLTRTALSDGYSYSVTAKPIDFGLRVDAVSAVPEPASLALLLAGLGVVALRRRQA